MALPVHLVSGTRFLRHLWAIGRRETPKPPTTRPAVEALEERYLLTGENPAVIPTPGTLPGWLASFYLLYDTPVTNPNVVFLGDSILAGYAYSAGTDVWTAQIAPLNAADYAISGSTTQNVLWEINQGILEGIAPKVVVLMVGTDNLAGPLYETPAQTAAGVQACVADIHAYQPQAQILLLGILPREASPADPLRAEIAVTNQLIAPLGILPQVRYADIGGWFLEPDGSISTVVLDNYLHPTTWGYELLTAAINPALHQLLGFPPPALPYQFFAVGDALGRVEVYSPANVLIADFAPFGLGYSGPVSVAVGDVTGDGYDDLVVGARAGNPDVRVYNGAAFAFGTFDPFDANASLLAEFFAYGLNFNIGANVAVGDIERDGAADIVTGATAGNPQVNVYRGKDIATHTFRPTVGASLLTEFFAYGLNFNIGANVAVGDIEHTGYADIVTGPTAGNPQVNVYRGRDIATRTFNPVAGASLVTGFFAYGLSFNVGANVAVGDTSGDGYGDVITGATSGNPDVHVYRGRDIALGTFDPSQPTASLSDHFFAFTLGANTGVTVGAADFEHNGHADILTGYTVQPVYRVVRATSQGAAPPAVFQNVPPDLQGGLTVGA